MVGRLQNLQTTLRGKNINALFVTNFYNILYLTGYSAGRVEEREIWALATKTNIYIFVDGRNWEDLKHHTSHVKKITPRLITQDKRLTDHLQEICEKKVRRLGFEEEDLKIAELKHLRKKLKKIKLVGTKNVIEELREIKDEREIAKLKKAASIADRCLREVIKTLKIGQTEAEIAYRIENWFRKNGHEPSFDPIVAFGANAAIPHYNPKKAPIKLTKNTLILIDFGVRYREYCSDTTRMFSFGKISDEIKNVYQKLLDAQEQTIESIRTKTKLKDIDKLCRKLLKSRGLPNFTHSTGHGVGLQVHEAPSVSPSSKDTKHAGQVFTIEPGIYVKGKYGMRIEDMVYIKKNSKVEILTKFPKKLIQL